MPPEPSFAELDTTEDLGATGDRLETLSGKLGDDDAFDFDDGDFYDPLLDQTIETMASSPGTFKLEKSQKMSLDERSAGVCDGQAAGWRLLVLHLESERCSCSL